MTRRIDALVAAMTGSGGPGAAVAVTCRGEPVYQGCFGLADVEWRQPVSPDTVFALASLSKPFTAITVVLLARDGLIDLDAAVGDYLPEYAGAGRAALIRHLLTHTSGIPNFLNLPGFRDCAAHLDHTPAELMEVFAALPLEFEPGTRYGYSNSGYRLLDIIIEKVTGAPFDEVITERVFRPTGMTGARLLTDRAVIPWRARGYELAADGELSAARHLSMTIAGGAGGLAASLQDMLGFDQAMRGHALLSPQDERQMQAPTPLTSGWTEGYGMGWVLTTYRGTPVISHAGGIDGFSCFYARFPEHDTSLIILSNRHGFPCQHLARKVTDEILDLPRHVAPTPSAGPAPTGLAGTYLDTLDAAQLSVAVDRLIISHAGQNHAMIPAGPTAYIGENDPDTRLRVHASGRQPVAITIDYPFTWFTGYRSPDDG
jgi:D-alanyl-D-alanine carboxypeptidase